MYSITHQLSDYKEKINILVLRFTRRFNSTSIIQKLIFASHTFACCGIRTIDRWLCSSERKLRSQDSRQTINKCASYFALWHLYWNLGLKSESLISIQIRAYGSIRLTHLRQHRKYSQIRIKGHVFWSRASECLIKDACVFVISYCKLMNKKNNT